METDNTIDTDSAAIFEEMHLIRNVDHDGNIWFHNRNGRLHRNFGPAYISVSGYQAWYYRGKRHRIGGPAEIHPDGRKYWFINGIQYQELYYWKEVEGIKNGNR